MRHFIGYVALTVVLGLLAYFAFSLVWFAFVGHRNEKLKTIVITSLGYLMVLASVGLWFWGVHRFVYDPEAYVKARTLTRIGVVMCVAAIVMARFSTRRTSISIIAGALVVALNWIGSVISD
jgi:hypothetical protein